MPSLAIHSILIPPEFRHITNYQSVPITVKVVDNLSVTGNKVLITPSSGVNITIYGPDDSVVINNIAMEFISLGFYIYSFKQSGGALVGAFSAKFAASDSGSFLNTDKYYLFTTYPEVYT